MISPMRCRVLLFAQLVDALGHREFDLEVGEDATVADAMNALCAEHPAIEAMRDRVAVAVDESYQPGETRLTDGCTLALIPPVSGG